VEKLNIEEMLNETINEIVLRVNNIHRYKQPFSLHNVMVAIRGAVSTVKTKYKPAVFKRYMVDGEERPRTMPG